MKKKLVILLASLATCAALMTGCGGEEETEKLDSDGLDSLLDALSSDVDDDDDIDLFDDNDDEDEEE